MPDKHYLYGGSTADIWLNCDGAMTLARFAPEVEPGEAAQRGTRIHKLAEKIFNKEECGECDTEEYCIANNYVNHIQSNFPRDGMDIEVAWKLSKTIGGTIDGIAISSTDIWIWDLKTGKKRVNPEHNWQLLFYRYIYYPNNDVRNVHLGIFQNGEMRWWHPSREEIDAAMDRFASRLAAIDTPDGPLTLTPGSHCLWCKAKPVCKRIRAEAPTEDSTKLPALDW